MWIRHRIVRYTLIILVLLSIFLAAYFIYYSFFPSRQLIAKQRVGEWLFESGIDGDLFQGPILVEENEKYSVFQFLSIVPKYGDTIIEILVAEGSGQPKGFNTKGKRPGLLYLSRTRYLPLNEAMLSELLGLPLSPSNLSEEDKHIIDVSLNESQIEAAADFIEIKKQLGEYYFKYNIGYPDSLIELDIQDIYTVDNLGNIYMYSEMGDYVILGDQGADRKWNIDSALIDSLYANNKNYIFTADDDILVKFKPIY